MGNQILPNIGARRNVHLSIEQWRNHLLDSDVNVDDKQLALNRAIEELRETVSERNHAAGHLTRLVDWHPELAGGQGRDAQP